jgi:hypothetical protein
MALMLVGRQAPAGPSGGADHRCGDRPGRARGGSGWERP